MNTKKTITLLTQWEKEAKELTLQMHKLDQVLECYVESPLCRAVWIMLDSYTDTLSALLNDEFKWLGWYQAENAWGENELKAKARKGDKLKPIRNIKDLARLIERSNLP